MNLKGIYWILPGHTLKVSTPTPNRETIQRPLLHLLRRKLADLFSLQVEENLSKPENFTKLVRTILEDKGQEASKIQSYQGLYQAILQIAGDYNEEGLTKACFLKRDPIAFATQELGWVLLTGNTLLISPKLTSEENAEVNTALQNIFEEETPPYTDKEAYQEEVNATFFKIIPATSTIPTSKPNHISFATLKSLHKRKIHNTGSLYQNNPKN